jgi:hypothetical protein
LAFNWFISSIVSLIDATLNAKIIPAMTNKNLNYIIIRIVRKAIVVSVEFLGVMSPYPTVEIVVKDQYKDTPYLSHNPNPKIC